MKKRPFFRFFISALVLSVLGLNGLAQVQHAGIPAEDFAPSYAEQKLTQWCWAACLQMIFTYNGHPLAQEKIVSSVFGGYPNRPSGGGRLIAAQLNRPWIDDNNSEFSSTVKAVYDLQEGIIGFDNRVLVDELNSGHPMIIGVGGHTVVLTAVDYMQYPNGMINVVRAVVFDPWPGRGERLLTVQEMVPVYPTGFFFAVTARIK